MVPQDLLGSPKPGSRHQEGCAALLCRLAARQANMSLGLSAGTFLLVITGIVVSCLAYRQRRKTR